MKFSYKNHKKHKMYPDGHSEKEKKKELSFSLNSTALSRLLNRILDFVKSKFPS